MKPTKQTVLNYYFSRVMDCFKNPKEISAVILRKLKIHQSDRRPSDFIWERCSRCPVKRAEASLVQIKHEVFVIGGFRELDHVLNDVEVLDLKKGRWTTTIKMPAEMAQTHIGTIGDGERYVYCIAGQKGPQCHPAIQDCFVLDTQLKTWGHLPPLPKSRYAPTVQLWHGRLHVLGGSKEDRNTPANDHWSIAVNQGKSLEDKWREETPIPRGGPHRASTIIQDKFYVFGGEEGDVKPIKGDPAFRCDWNTPMEIVYGDTFVLEAGTTIWQKIASMPLPTTHTEACVLINNRFVLLVGGNHGREKLSEAIQVYDADTNTWQVINRLPYHMKTAAAYYDGYLYLVTGQCSKSSIDLRPGEVQNTVWRTKFTPST